VPSNNKTRKGSFLGREGEGIYERGEVAEIVGDLKNLNWKALLSTGESEKRGGGKYRRKEGHHAQIVKKEKRAKNRITISD